MSDQRHPYAGHPAAAVLADHREVTTARGAGGDRKVRCTCDGWDGRDYDHPAHQTEVLDQAGLLKSGQEVWVWVDCPSGHVEQVLAVIRLAGWNAGLATEHVADDGAADRPDCPEFTPDSLGHLHEHLAAEHGVPHPDADLDPGEGNE